MKNRRLKQITATAVEMGLRGGRYELDGYNQKVVTDGVSFAITTRISASCDHWLLEVYEGFYTDTAGDKPGVY